MKAKTMANFLAITLMISMFTVMPTMAAVETSYDMEEWTQATEDAISVPVGFEVVPGTGAQITCDTEDVAGNKSKKMKIVHTEETTTTVSVSVLDKDYEDTFIEVYWSFFLGEDFQGTGVKMTQTRASGVTDYFKDNSYTWWRKMMIGSRTHAYKAEITVEFTGSGTVYLDDVTWKMPFMIMNGDFEGLSGDGRPAAYGTDNNQITGLDNADYPWRGMGTGMELKPHKRPTEDATPLDQGAYFVETPAGNYIEFVGKSRNSKLNYNSTSATTQKHMEAGKSYEVLVSHQSTNGGNGLGFSFTGGFANTTPNKNQNWTTATTDWTEKRWVGVYMLGTTEGAFQMNLHPHNWKKSSDTALAVCRIDNVRMQETKENVILTKEAGESSKNLVNGEKMTVTLEKPLFDSTDVNAVTSGTKSTKRVSVYAALYDTAGEAPRLIEVKVSPDVCAESLSSGDAVPKGPSDTLGFLPATHPETFEIPETGEYMLKLFIWDSEGKLIPESENVYTFTTATAPEA